MRRHWAFAATVVMVAGLIAWPAVAQIRGVPASVTSLGRQGEIRGVPASVTSLGPLGFQTRRMNAPFGFHVRLGDGHRGFGGPFVLGRHSRRGFNFPGAFPFYSGFPGYTVVTPMISEEDYAAAYDDAYSDQIEPPAPTIFEHRATTARRLESLPSSDAAPSTRPAPQASAPEPIPDQPATVLVFRDGHQLEVRNYAIVGGQLINLSGTPRKIALADLDVANTTKVNDDNGVQFRLP